MWIPITLIVIVAVVLVAIGLGGYAADWAELLSSIDFLVSSDEDDDV